MDSCHSQHMFSSVFRAGLSVGVICTPLLPCAYTWVHAYTKTDTWMHTGCNYKSTLDTFAFKCRVDLQHLLYIPHILKLHFFCLVSSDQHSKSKYNFYIIYRLTDKKILITLLAWKRNTYIICKSKNKISDFIYVFIYLFFTVFHISNDFY